MMFLNISKKGVKLLDFLVNRFSEWLTMNDLSHELHKVKGGYIIQFIEPSEDLKNLIGSLFISVDTGKEELKHPTSNMPTAIRKPLNIFTSGGDGIVIEDKYVGDILNTVYPILRNYVTRIHKKAVGGI